MGTPPREMVDERLFDGTSPTPMHGKRGIAFTVHCLRIRVSTLLYFYASSFYSSSSKKENTVSLTLPIYHCAAVRCGSVDGDGDGAGTGTGTAGTGVMMTMVVVMQFTSVISAGIAVCPQARPQHIDLSL
ncbi:hypothetical protein HZH66_014454 [Vespula vulgaris]|uniref:Uncharacterized protein n=1 Tax=Vespula vulgaris TaxID=7454 RepID=A0A834J446_VESVU|nr:hypothetical protein HZH66_014454 [Vespula vulgaris]